MHKDDHFSAISMLQINEYFLLDGAQYFLLVFYCVRKAIFLTMYFPPTMLGYDHALCFKDPVTSIEVHL